MTVNTDRPACPKPLVRWLSGLSLAAFLVPIAVAQSSPGLARSTPGPAAAVPAQSVASGTPAGGNKAGKPPVARAAAQEHAVVDKPAKAGTQAGAVTTPASAPGHGTQQR